MEKANNSGMSIQSIVRAMNIMNFIAEHGNSVSLSEISLGVGLGTSTTHNILRTLKMGGFVTQWEYGGKYSIGHKVLLLSHMSENNFPLIDASSKYITELGDKYNESVNLYVYSDGYIVYVGGVESKQEIRIVSYIGKRNFPHVTGAGKVLLAFMPSRYVEEYLKKPLIKKTSLTITDKERFRAVLSRVREQGYALDEGEYLESIWCAAAPIMNTNGECIAAVSISFPADRINGFNKDLVIDDVIKTARKISKRIGNNL